MPITYCWKLDPENQYSWFIMTRSACRHVLILSWKSVVNSPCLFKFTLQGLSQDLETWCPKLAIVKYWGTHIGTMIYLDFIYRHVKNYRIRHDILIQCHGNHMEMKIFNYMLEIDILRNSSQKIWVSWGVLFKGLGVQKDTQDALLAETMWHLVFSGCYSTLWWGREINCKI